MNRGRIFLLLGFLALASGCAVGQQYDYQTAKVALPLSGSGEVSIGVIDNRSYVLNGKKEPNFIGVERGGYGNPFNVTTLSGNSLTQDMTDSLVNALGASGYNVTSLNITSTDSNVVASAIANEGVDKNIVLTVTEWKTDIYMSMTLHFDLLLEVFSGEGEVLASNKAQGEEKVGGSGMQSQKRATAADVFETKIGRLFNDPAVVGALQN